MHPDHKINPPVIGDRKVLHPPLNPTEYMKWLKDNKAALRRFFGEN